ncbi:serine/threonine-protein kinase [Actinomadura rupiterrae]|uniref:serine/threonine-protein kinase n=1 Tax=Actinomadura rupiterrae TaxID=559627 RepID=UPI0020A54BB2|nr:serine/threonine-protein kinase [Actinomadura rupiterrae]MCP2336490.1 serine/threonine-protein kinase [Actinomadura rupiterrae]
MGGFEEVRELGAGAQGRVVLARHEGDGTAVAIKYLNVPADDPDERERRLARLRDEAVMLGRVADPHVVRLFRFVTAPEGAALVMEAVDGVPLARVLAENGALAPEAALTVLKGSLRGLAAAHKAGIVHRDYKPGNVVVRPDGLSKLVDFGIAVPVGEASAVGTPAYMAPEQWRGGPASPATDVYAATCVFVEAVTGERPFSASSQAALANLHLTAPPPLERLPEPLRPLVGRGMAKDAADRPPSAAAFAAELEAVASAAYGPEWESRGVRVLAGLAMALAAFFPAAALGGASLGGTAAGTAGAAGIAGGGGLLAATGAKVAAAVVATAIVAGGAGTYVAVTNPGHPAARPSPKALKITLASVTTVFHAPDATATVAYPRVTGLASPDLENRVNRILRAPADEWSKAVHEDYGGFVGTKAPPGPLFRPAAVVDFGLKGPRYLSVRYRPVVAWRNTPQKTIVTVDLATGTRLDNRDLLLPAVDTVPGARDLTLLLERHTATGVLCKGVPHPTGPETDLKPEAIEKGYVRPLLTATGVEFYVPKALLGYDMACNRADEPVIVPYRDLRGTLRPNILKAITGT